MEIRRDVFQAIADPTRRDILNLLTHKSLNLNSIAENFDVSRPAISQHIKILTECGLIVIDQKGRERYCQVQPEKLSAVADWLEPFRKMWENRFNQLDNLLNQLKEDKDE
ncbi:metalloregulator ArsR/SmtB family transcription factor [Imperialibacter roseus]|uniref:Metalloregulator ArsR/SmtB family transcription factor n=1 Tax=Imperialibacter roseus TaxID=1324217 RepID=A0ABZ0IU35_9BACT|nr:metalloregulator ArsR/SmtB family transcription factor [Imperialibacter roseus]WOK07465.1 metalloregulator ArsR/SmtB family transcription factor [Imperialibacter roseus]